MILCIDIGNTVTEFGAFEGKELLVAYKTNSDIKKSQDEYRGVLRTFLLESNLKGDFEGVIISSVVPSLLVIYVSLSKEVFGLSPLIVGPRLKTGLALKVDHPNEVGSDLVCDSVGAVEAYGSNLFIADLGTASKFIYIDSARAYSGLAIGVGLRLAAEALNEKTAALPSTSLIAPKFSMGKNTADCLNSGLTYGMSFMTRGFAESFAREAGQPLKKILTGGNAFYLKDILNDFIYDEHLLLKGLASIYWRNKK